LDKQQFKTEEIGKVATEKLEDVERFWEKQINNLAIRYPSFSQEQTYMTCK